MTTKTKDLIGPALDWAVAKIEGHQWRCPWILEKEGLAAWYGYEQAWGNPTPDYSTDWSQGGPIIDKMIERGCSLGSSVHDGQAVCRDWTRNQAFLGETILIAAMRCHVASKLGDDVDVPEELLT